MRFEKWQALANDYVIVEAVELADEEPSAELVRALCDRHTGIGADGVLVLRSGALPVAHAPRLRGAPPASRPPRAAPPRAPAARARRRPPPPPAPPRRPPPAVPGPGPPPPRPGRPKRDRPPSNLPYFR